MIWPLFTSYSIWFYTLYNVCKKLILDLKPFSGFASSLNRAAAS